MTAFLLIWSPKKWPWPELPDIAKRVAAGEAVADVWGCGFARGILPGDRVFLHRVAQEPKGVFGSGWVTRAPYEVRDPSTKRGYRLCIDFVYDWLVDAHQAPVIPRDALRVHPFSVQTWDAQSSGTVIKPIAEGGLEKRWAEQTGRRPRPVAAVQADAGLPSGPVEPSKRALRALLKQAGDTAVVAAATAAVAPVAATTSGSAARSQEAANTADATGTANPPRVTPRATPKRPRTTKSRG